MPMYKVTLVKTVSFYHEVEADDEDAALEMAYELAPDLCAGCTGYSDDWSVEDGEWEEESVESSDD